MGSQSDRLVFRSRMSIASRRFNQNFLILGNERAVRWWQALSLVGGCVPIFWSVVFLCPLRGVRLLRIYLWLWLFCSLGDERTKSFKLVYLWPWYDLTIKHPFSTITANWNLLLSHRSDNIWQAGLRLLCLRGHAKGNPRCTLIIRFFILFRRRRGTERWWREITVIFSWLAGFFCFYSLFSFRLSLIGKRILLRWEWRRRCQIAEAEGHVLVLNVVLTKDLTGAHRWALIYQLVSIFFDVKIKLLSEHIIVFSSFGS